MNRPKVWLRNWLGIEAQYGLARELTNCAGRHEVRIAALETELARLKVERYVPPSQLEPERKVIRTQNFKQYQDILEQEFAQKEE